MNYNTFLEKLCMKSILFKIFYRFLSFQIFSCWAVLASIQEKRLHKTYRVGFLLFAVFHGTVTVRQMATEAIRFENNTASNL